MKQTSPSLGLELNKQIGVEMCSKLVGKSIYNKYHYRKIFLVLMYGYDFFVTNTEIL